MNKLTQFIGITALCFVASGVVMQPAEASELSASIMGIRVIETPSIKDVKTKLHAKGVRHSDSSKLAHGVKRAEYTRLAEVNKIFERLNGYGVYIDDQLAFYSLKPKSKGRFGFKYTPELQARHDAQVHNDRALIDGFQDIVPHTPAHYDAIESIYAALNTKYGKPTVTHEGLDSLARYNDAYRKYREFSRKHYRPVSQLKDIKKQQKALKKESRALGKLVDFREIHTWSTDNGLTDIRFIKRIKSTNWHSVYITIAFVNLEKEQQVRDRINGQAEYEAQQHKKNEANLQNVL